MGRPSPEFFLIGQEKHPRLAGGVLDSSVILLQFNFVCRYLIKGPFCVYDLCILFGNSKKKY